MKPVDVAVVAVLIVCAIASALGFFDDSPSGPENPGIPAEQPRRPVPEGPALPPPDPSRDPVFQVRLEERTGNSVGTAFSLDADGIWMTARHVLEDCDRIGIVAGPETAVQVEQVWSHPNADLAVLSDTIRRPALLASDRLPRLGEAAYGFGYPRGEPGDVVGTLMGRATSITVGRNRWEEPVLVWSESARFPNFRGSLAGISGGPLLASDGRVLGVIISGEPRRGRFNTAAPQSLAMALERAELEPPPADARFGFNQALESDAIARVGGRLRRIGTVSLVVCITG